MKDPTNNPMNNPMNNTTNNAMNNAINDATNNAMNDTIEHDDLNISSTQIQTSRDPFDNWLFVDTFIHQYCLEYGFGYQIFCNDKDLDNPSITYRKSFCCSSSRKYKAQKSINQNSHHIHV
ncbi:15456_t:CDS:2 [Gigaspora margarita]|uniref:15456_t:CDS:1 n=1 Tax=Gigaspora margarita TaxID=4874 RepID=A0ABN7UVM9_GIGMA|nr:15456_t:CDS:2 [Gigaspora margarita]